MATTTIPWGDGSRDNIYLDYPAASGDQTVAVSSDANTGAARSKVVTFSASGVTPVSLTVAQGAAGPPYYGYQVLGTPSIADGIVQTQGLGGIVTTVPLTPGSSAWEIIFRVKFDTLAEWGTALGTRTAQGGQLQSVAIQTRTNKSIYMFLSSNGSSWNIHSTYKTLGSPSTWNRFKLSFSGTQYALSYYNNGAWTAWITKNSTAKIFNAGQSGYISFGQWFDNGVFYNNMSIDLSVLEIYVGGQLYWKALAP